MTEIFRAPLFDRLQDDDPKTQHESVPFRGYDIHGLFESIAEEVGRLLNTRSFYARYDTDAMPDEVRWSVLGYGFMDFSNIPSENIAAWEAVSEILAETIMRFEPRFLNVHVEIEDYDPTTQTLVITVYGDVLVNQIEQRIKFQANLESFDSPKQDLQPPQKIG